MASAKEGGCVIPAAQQQRIGRPRSNTLFMAVYSTLSPFDGRECYKSITTKMFFVDYHTSISKAMFGEGCFEN